MQIKPLESGGEVPREPVQPRPTPAMVAKPSIDKKKVAIAIAVVVGILVIGLIGYFVFFRGDGEEVTVEEVRDNVSQEVQQVRILIKNLQLATSIDDNFNYIPRNSSEYNLGETIWIYYEIFNIKSVKTDGSFSWGVYSRAELEDPDGELVEWVTDENSFIDSTEVDSEKYYSTKARSRIDTSRLNKTGTYSFVVSASNINTNESAAFSEISFTIK